MVHIERKRKRQDEIIGKAKEFGTITSKYSIELIINKKRKDYFHPTTSRRTKMNFVKILIETMLVPLSLFLHTIGLDFGHVWKLSKEKRPRFACPVIHNFVNNLT